MDIYNNKTEMFSILNYDKFYVFYFCLNVAIRLHVMYDRGRWDYHEKHVRTSTLKKLQQQIIIQWQTTCEMKEEKNEKRKKEIRMVDVFKWEKIKHFNKEKHPP